MKLLLVVHGYPPDALGGTEIYTRDLARALQRSGQVVSVLAREADPARPDYAQHDTDDEGIAVHRVNYLFRDCTTFEGTYRNPRMRAVVARLLDEIRPDVVHVQHLTCLTTDLVVECSRRRVPVFFTLNDYWLICQRGQLLDLDLARCDGPHRGCRRCADAAIPQAALRLAPAWRAVEPFLPDRIARLLRRGIRAGRNPRSTPGPSPPMARRIAHVRWIASHVNLFLAPSETLRARFVDFGIPEAQIRRVEQGIDQGTLLGAHKTPGRDGSPLRIGFLGSLIVSKAPHLLLEAFAGLPPGSATLEVFGSPGAYHGDDRYAERLRPLLALKGVRHHGPIPHQKIAQAFAAIDVLVVPSVWLENAPFVIREARVARVPVVASNLGGMAEMVRHQVDGLLFEPGSADDLRRALARLTDEPGLLERLREGIPGTMTIDEDAAQLVALYRNPPHAPRRLPRLAAVVVNFRTPHETLLAVRSLTSSARAVDDIVVVENGSNDDSPEILRRLLPDRVRLIANEENLGFSGGCNKGIHAALDAGAERVFLLNSDAMIAADTIGRLEEALDSHPRAAVAGPLILSANDPAVVASAGLHFDRLTGRMRQLGAGATVRPDMPRDLHEVAAVSGCAMLVDGAALARTGLLDQDYFFSFEDLAFGLAAKREGFVSIVVPDAIAWHLGSRSIGHDAPGRSYYAARNHLLLARRAAPIHPLLSPLRFASIVALNFAHAAFVARRPGALGAVARGVVDHLRGRYGALGSPGRGPAPRG